MEQRFKTSGQDIDLLPLREFIEREGEAVAYRRGNQMQRCPGIVDLLDLQDIASFLRSTSGRFGLQRTSIPTPSARFAATSRLTAGNVTLWRLEVKKMMHFRPLS